MCAHLTVWFALDILEVSVPDVAFVPPSLVLNEISTVSDEASAAEIKD